MSVENAPAPRRSRTRRIVFPLVTAVVALVVLLIGVELLATMLLTLDDGRYIDARTRFAGRTNTFITDLIGERADCRYMDTLYPHPYLAFVHHANPPCGLSNVNNIGLLGPDFPNEKHADRFTILVTGGSVASQFAQPLRDGQSDLQRILNERFESPTGKPFLVLDGGDGAWKQPQQLILFAMYANVLDAVVTLDGYNELLMLGATRRMEYPASNFHLVNPLATQAYPEIAARWFVGRLHGYLSGHALLSRSHAAYALASSLDDLLQDRINMQPAPKTSLDTMLGLPTDWPEERRAEYSLQQYLDYMRAMQAIARERGIPAAYFIQPVPAVGKTLSAEERKVAGPLDYAPRYEWMTKRLLTLREAGLDVFSMAEVFKDRPETLYGDHIHLLRAPDSTSLGYRLMSERMAEDLGRTWKLKPRSR